MKRTLSEEHKKKISEAHMGSKRPESYRLFCKTRRGENSPNWKGGVSLNPAIYLKKWRHKKGISKKSNTKSTFKMENYIKAKNDYGIGLGTIYRYGLKLALEIYDKAKRKCEQCDGVYDLTIHHKDGNGRNNYEKGLPVNNHSDNLMVLCRKCHGSIHGKEAKGIPKPNLKKESEVRV